MNAQYTLPISLVIYVIKYEEVKVNNLTLFLMMARVEEESFVISVPIMIGDLAIAHRPK